MEQKLKFLRRTKELMLYSLILLNSYFTTDPFSLYVNGGNTPIYSLFIEL